MCIYIYVYTYTYTSLNHWLHAAHEALHALHVRRGGALHGLARLSLSLFILRDAHATSNTNTCLNGVVCIYMCFAMITIIYINNTKRI